MEYPLIAGITRVWWGGAECLTSCTQKLGQEGPSYYVIFVCILPRHTLVHALIFLPVYVLNDVLNLLNCRMVLRPLAHYPHS